MIAGALIGAIIGGVAGSELAASNTDCNPRVYGNVPPPTRNPYGRGWNEPRPIAHDPYADQDLYGGRDYKDRQYEDYAEPSRYEERYPRTGRECRTVTRVTTLPSGEQLREDAQACRNSPNDDWALQ